MKIKPKLDRRGDDDYQKIDDREWNMLCRNANLTRQQQICVGQYLDKQIKRKIREVENSVRYAALIYLRESHRFGAIRLARANQGINRVIVDAYDRDCIDANGVLQTWDGCGLEHLEQRLKANGINVEDEE